MTSSNFFRTYGRMFIFVFVVLLHIALLMCVKFVAASSEIKETEPSYEVLKLVDIEEYVPPVEPEPEPEEELPPPEVLTDAPEPEIAEIIVETEEKPEIPIETSFEKPDMGFGTGTVPYVVTKVAAEPEYLPQHKISSVPEIPSREVLAGIVYPPMALKQGIEGVVYLELFIDKTGCIRKINVLKDPGYGFAEAAVASLDGIVCKPATANGESVAVRFRYPVRFTLK